MRATELIRSGPTFVRNAWGPAFPKRQMTARTYRSWSGSGRTGPRLAAGLGLAVLVLLASPVLAKSSLGIGSAEVTAPPGDGLFSGIFVQIAVWQRAFFTALRHALVAMKDGGGGLGFLIGLSFSYGVFHAAGPGHGKAVVSSYMLASRAELKRGVALSFLSSLAQAGTAILLVGGGWYLLRGTGISMTDASDWLEIVSYGLVASFGAVLLARALQRFARRPAIRNGAALLRARVPIFAGRETTGSAMGMLAFASPAGERRATAMPAARAVPAGLVCEADAEACDCGRAHIPAPRDVAAPMGMRSALAAILAIGLRPCSGAIVVLTFALLNGLVTGGVLSVLAMALGTAITVSALATVTVVGRGALERASRRSAAAPYVASLLEVLGAALLLLVGIGLLGGALATV